jgi:hypothetical protein
MGRLVMKGNDNFASLRFKKPVSAKEMGVSKAAYSNNNIPDTPIRHATRKLSRRMSGRR